MLSDYDERMAQTLALGQQQLNQGDLGNAITSFTKVLLGDLSDNLRPAALLGRSRSYLSNAKIKEARDDLDNLSRLLGNSNENGNENSKEDKELVQQLQKLKSDFAERVSQLLAQGLEELNNLDLENAIVSFAQVIQANLGGSECSSAHLGRAQAYMLSRMFTPVREHLDTAERLIAPTDQHLLSQLQKLKTELNDKINTLDFDTFVVQLRNDFEQARLEKSFKMLKKESFQLFSEVKEGEILGVVKSQTNAKLLYACRLTQEGAFSCCTQNVLPCGGLQGSLCKHLFLLLIGLAKAALISPTRSYLWAKASTHHIPKLNKELMSEVFLRYKSAEIGEIDWRPTQTIPEDYYAF